MNRRDFIKTPLTISALAAASHLPAQRAGRPAAADAFAPDPTDWQLTNIKADAGNWPAATAKSKAGPPKRSKAIEGYCRQQSVEAGQKLEICVSTEPARHFTLKIFRMGYYGGAGARLVRTIGPLKGMPQPEPPVGEMRLRECQWEPSLSLEIPADWPSGIYLGKLACVPETKNEHAWQNYVIFIVRDRRKADILYQASDNTWAAYNRWPDNYSLYTDPRGGGAFDVAVSFDRPITKDPHIFNHPLSLGSGHFFLWEFPLVYWLEQHGYDVTYASNSDMIDPAQIGRTKVFLSSGHDEYWDLRQYENALASIQKGVTHLYLCGNAVWGVTPFTSSADGRPNRTITRKGAFIGIGGKRGGSSDKPMPIIGPAANKLIGAQTVFPANGGGDWICVKPEHWIFEGTGMKKGDAIPGLVGHEYHGDPADIPGLEVVAEGDTLHLGRQPVHWTSTIYPGPKKNFVFSASTVWWNQGLASPPGHILQWYHGVRCHGPDPRVQRITLNLLRRALA